MKKIVIGFLFLFLVGCAPTLTITKDGVITAKGYHSIIQKDKAVSFIAKPWWSISFTKDLAGLADKLITGMTTVVAPAKPPEKPPEQPPAVPVIPPDKPPVVPPTPPPPVTQTAVLFDLGPGPNPGKTWMLMQEAGFPCRENVCLYALGQVARGYPIPGQSEELVAIDAYYAQIKTWYEGKVNAGRAQLTANPSLAMTICANDSRDRFGFRLCPPTLDLFTDFGGRVSLGTIAPESEY